MKTEERMTPQPRRRYTHEFKAEAGRLVRDSARSVAHVARDLGIAAAVSQHQGNDLAEGQREGTILRSDLLPTVQGSIRCLTQWHLIRSQRSRGADECCLALLQPEKAILHALQMKSRLSERHPRECCVSVHDSTISTKPYEG